MSWNCNSILVKVSVLREYKDFFHTPLWTKFSPVFVLVAASKDQGGLERRDYEMKVKQKVFIIVAYSGAQSDIYVCEYLRKRDTKKTGAATSIPVRHPIKIITEMMS